jgi:two-component system, cell cycle response regulator
MKINFNQSFEISPGIHWVGFKDDNANFHCNPYLIVDGNESILIDPGSVTHYPIVSEKVFSLVKPEQIKYIILHHQDPDLCASVPLFEKKLDTSRVRIICNKRESFLINHYGMRSKFYLIEDSIEDLALGSGRKLKFIHTPYLHAPGAFITYDEISKIMFSSDLFGAFSDNWKLFADKDYPEQMKLFHEPYMPSLEIMEYTLDKLQFLDLEMIAPQHGSIIRKELVKYCFDALRGFEYGKYLV